MFYVCQLQPLTERDCSFGEFVALVVAEVLTLDDALRLVATRARLISEKCSPGVSNMTSARASMDVLTPLLAGTPGLGICCFNRYAVQIFTMLRSGISTPLVLAHSTRRLAGQ